MIAASVSVGPYEPFLVDSTCSPGVLNPSDSQSPQSSSSARIPQALPSVWLWVLHLPPSAARGSLSDYNWARHQCNPCLETFRLCLHNGYTSKVLWIFNAIGSFFFKSAKYSLYCIMSAQWFMFNHISIILSMSCLVHWNVTIYYKVVFIKM